MKKLYVASVIAATFAAAALPAAAKTNIDLVVNVGPPAVRYEPVPVARVGYVWTPGYWDWRHGKYYWVRGQYVRHRHGYAYQPASWVEHGGQWRYVAPAWNRNDRDFDGVPNRYDRAPDNPYRR